jgi:hypothetical protein
MEVIERNHVFRCWTRLHSKMTVMYSQTTYKGKTKIENDSAE